MDFPNKPQQERAIKAMQALRRSYVSRFISRVTMEEKDRKIFAEVELCSLRTMVKDILPSK